MLRELVPTARRVGAIWNAAFPGLQDMLEQAASRASRVGVLGHGANPTYAIYRRELEPAGRALGIALDFGPVDALTDIEATLSAMQRRGADAFLLMHQPFTFAHRQHIVDVVTRRQVPAIHGSREAVEFRSDGVPVSPQEGFPR